MPGLGVICDQCGANAPPMAGYLGNTGEVQRIAAREAGWVTYSDGKDYCPKCKDNVGVIVVEVLKERRYRWMLRFPLLWKFAWRHGTWEAVDEV